MRVRGRGRGWQRWGPVLATFTRYFDFIAMKSTYVTLTGGGGWMHRVSSFAYVGQCRACSRLKVYLWRPRLWETLVEVRREIWAAGAFATLNTQLLAANSFNCP